MRLKKPYTTLTVDVDGPSRDVANGLWNGCPIVPAPTCGIALARRNAG